MVKPSLETAAGQRLPEAAKQPRASHDEQANCQSLGAQLVSSDTKEFPQGTNGDVVCGRQPEVTSNMRAAPAVPLLPEETSQLSQLPKQALPRLHSEEDFTVSSRYEARSVTNNWRWLRAMLKKTDEKSLNKTKTQTDAKDNEKNVLSYNKNDALTPMSDVDAMMDELLDVSLNTSYSCQPATDSEMSEIWNYKPVTESTRWTNTVHTSNARVPMKEDKAFFYCPKNKSKIRENLKILRKIASDETEWFERSMSEVDAIIAGYLDEPEVSTSFSWQSDTSVSGGAAELTCFLCEKVFLASNFSKTQRRKGHKRCCDACVEILVELKDQSADTCSDNSDTEES